MYGFVCFFEIASESDHCIDIGLPPVFRSLHFIHINFVNSWNMVKWKHILVFVFFFVFCWFGFGITHTLILIVNFATSWIQCIVCICISFFLLRIIVTVLYYISVVYIFFCRNTFLICVRKLPWIVRFAGTLWKLSLNKTIYVFLYNNNETHWLTQKIPRRK